MPGKTAGFVIVSAANHLHSRDVARRRDKDAGHQSGPASSSRSIRENRLSWQASSAEAPGLPREDRLWLRDKLVPDVLTFLCQQDLADRLDTDVIDYTAVDQVAAQPLQRPA